MKLRPYLVVIALVGLICTIPLGVTAQNEDEYTPSWDVYETVWLNYNYHNQTTISIRHPVNQSLVSNNQKLNFIVVPFDVDDLFYIVKIYKNDILMYTMTLEQVYDVGIYTTNPVNQIVTISFTLNDIEILHLEYIAILTEPSLDRDFTDLWLQYQAEKMNETISGREHISARDKALSDINLIATTGLWSLVLAGIAIFFVLYFQQISVFNAFSGIVWFGSVYLGINGIRNLDAQMANLELITPDDVYIYYAKIIALFLIIAIANIFYILTYKATSTRLNRHEFLSIDKKNRRIIKHHAVLGRQRGTGKSTWVFQSSIGAIRRRIFGADYVIEYDGIGDFNDTYYEQVADHIPENMSNRKLLRDWFGIFREIQKRKVKVNSDEIFYVIPKPIKDENALDEIEKEIEDPKAPKKKKIFMVVKDDEPEEKPNDNNENNENNNSNENNVNNKDNREKKDKIFDDIKEKARDYSIWRMHEDGNPLATQIPIVILDGHPEIKEKMKPEKYDALIQEMKQQMADATDPRLVKDIKKRIKKTEKLNEKPLGYAVWCRLSNRNIYDLMDWVTYARYYDEMAKMLDKLWHENQELKVAIELKGIREAGRELHRFDQRLTEFYDQEVYEKERIK